MDMKLVALFLLLGAVSGKSVLTNNDFDEYWKEFKSVFKKSYCTGEEQTRRKIWEKNVNGIIQHNLEADMGKHTYRQGINEYSDMDYSEVLSKMTGLRSDVSRTNGSLWIPPSNVTIPDRVDWREDEMVIPVENQPASFSACPCGSSSACPCASSANCPCGTGSCPCGSSANCPCGYSANCPCGSGACPCGSSANCPCGSSANCPCGSGACPCGSSANCPCGSSAACPCGSGACPCGSSANCPWGSSAACPVYGVSSAAWPFGSWDSCPCGRSSACPCGSSSRCPCGSADCPCGASSSCPCGSSASCPCGSAACPCGASSSCPCGSSSSCPCGSAACRCGASSSCPCGSSASCPCGSSECQCGASSSCPCGSSDRCPCGSAACPCGASSSCPCGSSNRCPCGSSSCPWGQSSSCPWRSSAVKELQWTDKCQFAEKGVEDNCTGFVDIPSGDEEALKQAVATVGPISATIDSTVPGFGSYKNGVYDEPTCRTDVQNHSVLIVGYGTLDGVDYWLVKNSWGETWGMKGYIMMSRNKNNQCGIASKASYPLVKN